MESGKYDYQRQYQRQEDRQSRNEPLLGPSEKERARLESISYAEDERRSRYNMDRSRAERPSEVGGMYLILMLLTRMYSMYELHLFYL